MADDKKKLNLDDLHAEVFEKLNTSENSDEISHNSEKFNAILDSYDRYLDEKQKQLRQKPVQTKDIVADEDAVKETLKTYYAINKKLQQQIETGAELSANDIKLLVSMMTALNGGA